MTPHDRLVTLLVERSARRGSFTLASGRQSSLYIDARQTTMSPEGLTLIGPLAHAELRRAGWRVDSVGGLTLGADPIAYAIAYASALAATPLRAFTVRKEPKAHGQTKLIEGNFQKGNTVVVIDDVVTRGESTLKAIDAVEKEGGKVAFVAVLVDRQEGGRQRIEERGYSVVSLFTKDDLLSTSK